MSTSPSQGRGRVEISSVQSWRTTGGTARAAAPARAKQTGTATARNRRMAAIYAGGKVRAVGGMARGQERPPLPGAPAPFAYWHRRGCGPPGIPHGCGAPWRKGSPRPPPILGAAPMRMCRRPAARHESVRSARAPPLGAALVPAFPVAAVAVEPARADPASWSLARSHKRRERCTVLVARPRTAAPLSVPAHRSADLEDPGAPSRIPWPAVRDLAGRCGPPGPAILNCNEKKELAGPRADSRQRRPRPSGEPPRLELRLESRAGRRFRRIDV